MNNQLSSNPMCSGLAGRMVLKQSICLVFMLAVYAGASTLLQESFETLPSGSIDGQNNWVVESGAGDVQASEAFTGAQALEVRNGVVSHSISSSESAAWARFQVFITGAPDLNPTVNAGNTSVAFFVNTNLTLTVYSNTVPIELNVPIATNVWTRFDVYCDYESMIWNLSMDGMTVAAGLPLYSDSFEIEQVQISNNSADSVFIDDIDIRNEELTYQAPDFDSDGLPDWWELKYFSSITGCVANAMSGNPGWTHLQTYIAGISPVSTEPFIITRTGVHSLSWTAKPSRSYDVLWTTNLLAGFVPIASNLLSQSDFSDTTSNTNFPTGFYKLRVQVVL
jgi:hypothetical protein